jgi:hypothetical protein
LHYGCTEVQYSTANNCILPFRCANAAASSIFLSCNGPKKSATLKWSQIDSKEETFAETSYVLEQEHILKPLSAFPEKMRPYQVLFISRLIGDATNPNE